jgi:hypothetical protein
MDELGQDCKILTVLIEQRRMVRVSLVVSISSNLKWILTGKILGKEKELAY